MSYNSTRDFRAYLYSRFYAFSYEKNNPREWCVKHRQRIGIHSSMYLCIIASYTCDWELAHKNSLPYCTTTARAIQFPFWIWRTGKKMNFKIGDHDHFVRREKTKNYNEFGAVVVMCVCAMCSKRQMELFRSCLVALRCGSATDWIECTNIRTSFLKIIDIENVRLLRDANATIPFRRGR